ncbi:UDP-glucose 4-epimerase GalE [Arcobacter sp. s6]|uniref:UDP-glucose 4-epimerase GalE n=1 Tax=Arcobacter sp. s6 TaxID=3230363 RepID=UPI0034A00277
MQILVTGAAGYIGSHVVKQLLEQTDYEIIIIDNLSTGFQNTIDTLKKLDSTNKRIKFYNQDLSQWEKVEEIFKENDIKEIIHFAAFSQVAESMTNPIKYYSNNTINTTNLVKVASDYGVEKFIFSSTAAVYGDVTSENIPIKEDLAKDPINPYGSSKLFSESIIKDVASINANFKYVILRYFNVAGADIDGKVGENHDPETHLIPLVVKTALGKRDSIKIFGDDYDTEDGTCIRDYIHVCDLADAHIQALKYLETNPSDIFNCGYGYGYSVKEVVEAVKKVSNIDFKVDIEKRRIGDPAVLISDNTKIKTKMNWTPKYNDLELICKTALEWEKRI